MKESRETLLKTYEVDSLENLIAKQIKCNSENNINESKYESEIESCYDIKNLEKPDKDSSDDKTETLSMSESVIEKIVEEAPKKSQFLLSKLLKDKGYNIEQKDIEIEFKGKCFGIGPKTTKKVFEKIKNFSEKIKHSKAFPNSNKEIYK